MECRSDNGYTMRIMDICLVIVFCRTPDAWNANAEVLKSGMGQEESEFCSMTRMLAAAGAQN